ncbi:MAG: flavodoxin domain-containing protein [Candidatus Neomarinimicrobiota bacterium]|jgi:menaquinone-dependent protoporphyrinogen IX oxidase|nr:flavodoxin domain-containing protein [Candidatus Neomarinimicrobiota bacterium]MDD3967009.1 flavodoxin domain-containing protein [Candidatus Neomarinimicrobiota bacterium]MDX9779592.1 flavodoxin domain-containing protein [bacterium]
MSGLIVYYSTYGSTRDYAAALAEKTGWPALEMKKAGPDDIKKYKTLILASNIRIGKMGIRKWALKHRGLLKDRQVLALIVGGNPSNVQDYYQEVCQKQLDFLKLGSAQIFGLGGRKIRAEMKGLDAFMFKMLEKMIKDGKEREDILRDVDYINLQDLDRVVIYLQENGLLTKGKK